jgi:DhnA family fructose-bisphosphate aldolase class Ia
MTTYPGDHDPQESFSIGRTLGRIEDAIVNMASDIHDAVTAQKSIIERVEKDEKRLGVIESWKQNVDRRNETATRIFLLLLIPALALGFNAGVYVIKLINVHDPQMLQFFPGPKQPKP